MASACRNELAQRADALLPQTQCGRCGYAACRPYAEAVVAGEATNRCPPGGEAVAVSLARLLDRPIEPLDPALGSLDTSRRAVIDEARCIGCTLCIQACPVDAIVGGPKRLHGVLAALCTGCELCLPPCPVDCIAMVPAGAAWTPHDADAARERYRARAARLQTRAHGADGGEDGPQVPALRTAARGTSSRPVVLAPEERQAAVAAALARARARRRTA